MAETKITYSASDIRREGHIGADTESKLHPQATFTRASAHESTQTEMLISYDENALFGDKAYVDGHHKYSARHCGCFYGVLDKGTRSQPLSDSQKNEP